MSKCCENCTAFEKKHAKGGICRANPPSLMVFGMEKVNVPGLRGGGAGMRPLTGTGFPEVELSGWCRDGYRPVATGGVFDASSLKAGGEVTFLGGEKVKTNG